MKWASILKESSKKLLKLNTVTHINSGYTDIDEFLEHSPSGSSLYYKRSTLEKIIRGFLGPPPFVQGKEIVTEMGNWAT